MSANHMSLRSMFIGCFAVLFMAVTVPASAVYEENRTSGQACQGSTSTDRTALIYNQYGVQNNDTAAVHTVYCPNAWTGSIANTNTIFAMVTYFDRSTVDSMACRLEVVDSTGATYNGPYKYSCTTQGGCTTANASYAASTLNRLDLSLTHPVVGMYTFAVRCTVPRRSTSLGNFSGVLNTVMSFDAVGF